MAIDLGDNQNIRLQPSDKGAMDAEEKRSFSVSWKGPYSDLQTVAAAIVKGDQLPDPYDDLYAQTWELTKGVGAYGVLTINAVPADATTTQDQVTTAQPFKDVWSIKAVRNDVSILAYCGESLGANPQRSYIEKWQREQDGELAAANSFREPDGTVFDIDANSPATSALLAKIKRGVESVIRFYPLVVRKRYYYAAPPDVLDNIGFIDTPPTPDNVNGRARASSALNSKLSLYQWLKCQDDADEQADHTWIRSEAWMGILKTDGNNNQPWDADLYGNSRWPMPYSGA